jgi:hypothetical protein
MSKLSIQLHKKERMGGLISTARGGWLGDGEGGALADVTTTHVRRDTEEYTMVFAALTGLGDRGFLPEFTPAEAGA